MLGRRRGTLRLALPRVLVRVAEWMLRGAESAARSDDLPGAPPAQEAPSVPPAADRQRVGLAPHPHAALGAQMRRSEIQTPRPEPQSAEASAAPLLPDRRLEALRRRIAEAERRMEELDARTARATRVRPRAEPEWAEEVRTRAQRVLGQSPLPGLRSQAGQSPQSPADSKPLAVREPVRAELASPAASKVTSDMTRRSASSSVASVPAAAHEQVSTSVPQAAARPAAWQRSAQAQRKAAEPGARAPARAEDGALSASRPDARAAGRPRTERTADVEATTQSLTAPAGGQPGQTSKAVSQPILHRQPRPNVARRRLRSARGQGPVLQPDARDTGVPVARSVAESQSSAAINRSLRVLPPTDGGRHGERTIAAGREAQVEPRGERSQFPPASLWPLLPDEVQSGQAETEHSPWPDLPEESMMIEREGSPALQSGDERRYGRLEREQRGELWNA